MRTNKEIYKKYLYCKGNHNNHINYIESYKQQEEARSRNEKTNNIKKDIVKNLKSNIYGKLELFKESKYFDCNKSYKESKEIYVINKKTKDDIVLYLDFYGNVYSQKEIIEEGWKTERTKDGRLIWAKIY